MSEIEAQKQEITFRVGADPVTGHDRDFRVYEGQQCVAVFYEKERFEEYQEFLKGKEVVAAQKAASGA